MTNFQKLLLLLLLAFLSMRIYDEVESHSQAAASKEAKRQQEVWDGLHRCEDALPVDATVARQECKDFWIPQLAKP